MAHSRTLPATLGLALGLVLAAGIARAQAVGPFEPGAQITPPGLTAADVAALEAEGLDTNRPGVRLTIGAGPSYQPDYFGSDSYSLGGRGLFRFDFVRLPGGFEFGSSGPAGFLEGFGIRGAARYIGSRKASNNSELRGLDNVDASIEAGLGLGYDAQYWRAYGTMSYGITGHNSWVGELGADGILRPNDNWVLSLGPRAYWGSDRFMNTYFGVTASEAARSDFREYDPSSGFYALGAEFRARYAFSPRWGLEGIATYNRLVNDAGDSPITDVGSANQYGLSVVLTRSLSLGF